ncbi:PDDEXK-like family protein [Bhargavaea cecembensis]|uniref:PDDEXK-like family protein n=1 Tax=Bhargavaea cecembensis TaxID=394098 RepID=UPI00069406C1|nr:PD-(D/E)XK nuclease family protein [Bhargavaea cecembensis]
MKNQQAVEALVLDSAWISKLEGENEEINIFETLGVVHKELQHSNMIGWLLSPKENHGLGDVFLRTFLCRVAGDFVADLTDEEETALNLGSFTCRKEYRQMDLLLTSDTERAVIVIENKIWSGESEHQLGKYLRQVKEEFKDYHQLCLFLTPDGRPPSDQVNWIGISYEDILEVLEETLEIQERQISPDAKSILRQYIQTVRKHIVGDAKLKKYCQELYFKHRKAFDLIFEYKPDLAREISDALQKELHGKVELDQSTKSYIRFTTKDLDSLTPKGSTWTNSGRMLLFEIQNRSGRLDLKLIIGPGDPEDRRKLFALKKSKPDVMIGASKSLQKSYTQLYKTELVPMEYITDHESEPDMVIDEAVKSVNKFINIEMKRIEKVIIDFLG